MVIDQNWDQNWRHDWGMGLRAKFFRDFPSFGNGRLSAVSRFLQEASLRTSEERFILFILEVYGHGERGLTHG